jgi:CRISPR/Cas system type I-B associated protein Csh2 (Cas7 group RAMP superfamily)
MEEYRKNAGLTDEQVEAIKEAILASVYEDIGRSLVKKVIWVAGVVFTALLTWATAKGYLFK